jgi:hypothetical protein
MKIVFLGLSLSSSWGNGHATTYRALIGALSKQHEVLFLERDQPWYAANRDMPNPEFCDFALYAQIRDLDGYRTDIESADAVIIGSYVTEGAAVTRYIKDWVQGVFCFYDIDTPVTLSKLQAGDLDYVSPETIPLFDLYLSFTGGPTLERLRIAFGARETAALYCSVDETARCRSRGVGISDTSEPIVPTGSLRWSGCCWNPRVAFRTSASSLLARSSPSISLGRRMSSGSSISSRIRMPASTMPKGGRSTSPAPIWWLPATARV